MHVSFHRSWCRSGYWTVLCSIWWRMPWDLHSHPFSWICSTHGWKTPVRRNHYMVRKSIKMPTVIKRKYTKFMWIINVLFGSSCAHRLHVHPLCVFSLSFSTPSPELSLPLGVGMRSWRSTTLWFTTWRWMTSTQSWASAHQVQSTSSSVDTQTPKYATPPPRLL